MSDRQRGGKGRSTRAVIDRIEDGGTAVVYAGEDEGTKLELPASLLPEGAAAGSHILINVALDEDSRRASEERVRALQERLEKRPGNGGERTSSSEADR